MSYSDDSLAVKLLWIIFLLQQLRAAILDDARFAMAGLSTHPLYVLLFYIKLLAMLVYKTRSERSSVDSGADTFVCGYK